ncbi:MAG: replication initiation protein [Fusobacteriaceae bacterium]|nr:replication initiation protein [Fusobacteriaceae bacterium]
MTLLTNYLENKKKYGKLIISVNKKISKSEKDFLKFLFSKFINNQDKLINIELNEVGKYYDYKTSIILFDFLEKLSQKRISYFFENSKNFGSFPIISSFLLEENILNITISEEIVESRKLNTFYSMINPLSLVYFKNSHSHTIFLEIINSNNYDREEGELEFSLEEFKTLLNLNNLYPRFYDMERKVINPIIEDFNLYSNYKLNITKIKNGDSKISKIIKLKISYFDNKLKEIRSITNGLINMSKGKISNYDYVFNLISNSIKLEGYEYVLKNLKYALVHHQNENFDVFLEKAIKNDLSLYKANKDDNTFVISKMVTSTNMLYETISDMLIKLKLGDISKDNDFFSLFYRKLYILKDGENYAIKYKTDTTLIKVSINYHKNEKSIIKIEKENFTNN